MNFPAWPSQLGRDAYVVTDANVRDLATLDAWIAMDEALLVICGDALSGKSHLASIAAQGLGCGIWLVAENGGINHAIASQPGNQPGNKGAVVLDGMERLSDRSRLLEFIEEVRRENRRLVLVGNGGPVEWAGAVVDLATRLKAAPQLETSRPDEALMRGVLTKLVAERQLSVPREVIEFAASQLPRRIDRAVAYAGALETLVAGSTNRLSIRLATIALESIDTFKG
ncbi:MAG: hypothetical protein GC152_11820 [Alphaproteobacteria bacterium]|nr:hypothetical protein [Alphaproteobacteria bacterium]